MIRIANMKFIERKERVASSVYRPPMPLSDPMKGDRDETKNVGILYLLYFLLFLVDCYAARISLYSAFGEGYGLAASLSHVLGACLLYWSQRDARAAGLPVLLQGFYLAFVLFGALGTRLLFSRSHLEGVLLIFQGKDLLPTFLLQLALGTAQLGLLWARCRAMEKAGQKL